MRFAVAVFLTAWAVPAGSAEAAEKYFAHFFAFEDGKHRPEDCHTFVEFIRAEIQPGVPPIILQRDLISWLPANSVVRVRAVRAELGRNHTLEETLALVDSRGLRLMSWGPYEMTPRAYGLALARKAELESGVIDYKAIDVFTIANRSANCMHAAAEIDPQAKRIGEYNIKYGDDATRQVIRYYVRRGFLCNPCCVREDVFQVLGYDGRRIERRHDWEAKFPFRLLRPKLNCP
jgi:hypothetical protein